MSEQEQEFCEDRFRHAEGAPAATILMFGLSLMAFMAGFICIALSCH